MTRKCITSSLAVVFIALASSNLASGQGLSGHPVEVPTPERNYPCVILHDSQADIPGTSDLMEGSTAVALFIPNNTGTDARYPVVVVWTEQLLSEVIDNVTDNLQWWSDQAARSGLTFAHEVGHIFGLRDTYRERAPYTYNHEMQGFKNRNADFRNPNTVPCIMKNNWGFSSYTAARLGWIDEPGYTTIHPEPYNAPFAILYHNPEIGQPNAFYRRTFTGKTSLPLGLGHNISLSGFPETGINGMMYHNPHWSAPPEWSRDHGYRLDLSVEYLDPLDVKINYSSRGDPASVSLHFLHDSSPVTAARTRAVLALSDGSMAIAGLDGAVVLQNHEAFVLDAPHGRMDSMFRESRGLAEGPDGSLWFTTHFGEVIGWKDRQYTILPKPRMPHDSDTQWTRGVFGPLAIDPSGTVWTAEDPHGSDSRTGGSGLHRLESFGNPEHMIFNVRNSPLLSDHVTSLDIDRDGYLWIGFGGGRGGDFDQGLQRFHPENELWEDLSEALPNTQVQLVRYAGERIIIGYNGGFSEYKDGVWWHWETALHGIIRDADVDDNGNIFLATVSGLAVYQNGERISLFTTQNSPMPENHVAAVRIMEPGRLLTGFWNYGAAVLWYNQSLVTSTPATHLPSRVKLHQNYPNPFNPSTVIRFEVPHETDVLVEVFDILGRRVKTLVNGRLETGIHETAFDASGLASGVYLCQLQAGDTLLVRKMMLLR